MDKPFHPHPHGDLLFLLTETPESDFIVTRFLVRAVLRGCFNLCLEVYLGDYGEPASFSVMKFKAVPMAHPMW